MKLKFLVLLSVLSLNAFAQIPEGILTIPCRKEIVKILKKVNSKNKWTRTIDPQQGVKAFRTPTETFAKWVEIQSFENPYVFIYDTKKTHVYQFDKKSCRPLNNTIGKPFKFLSSKKEGFTDANLQVLVKSDRPSMIYIWSPIMVYSMREMHVFKKVAEQLNLNFVPVLDFNDNEEVAKKSVSYYDPDVKIQKLKSLELFLREGAVHFPTTYIVGNGRISPRIFGVLTNTLLTERVQNEMASLKQVEL